MPQIIKETELVYKAIILSHELLFPQSIPYNEGMLEVSKIHTLWYAEYGNPEGIPILFVHGGPGGGCVDDDYRYFDPKSYRIILFDQRGARKSKPVYCLEENTTDHLIEDMEVLRKELKIQQWVLCGGSWGSLLSILYGQAYPENCLGMILRGVFLGTKSESDHLWYGMKKTFPDAFEELKNFLPLEEQETLIESYRKRLLGSDLKAKQAAAYSYAKYEFKCSFLNISDKDLKAKLKDIDSVTALSSIFVHYDSNGYFIKENQVLKNIKKIEHLPCIIVNGRYDTVCPLETAFTLHKNWPNSQLMIVSDAGHTRVEPGTTKALIEAAEKMKSMLVE